MPLTTRVTLKKGKSSQKWNQPSHSFHIRSPLHYITCQSCLEPVVFHLPSRWLSSAPLFGHAHRWCEPECALANKKVFRTLGFTTVSAVKACYSGLAPLRVLSTETGQSHKLTTTVVPQWFLFTFLGDRVCVCRHRHTRLYLNVCKPRWGL